MNQPTSLCFGRPLFEMPNPAEDSTADSDEEQLCHLKKDQVLDYAQQPPDGDNDDFKMAYDPQMLLATNPSLSPHPSNFTQEDLWRYLRAVQNPSLAARPSWTASGRISMWRKDERTSTFPSHQNKSGTLYRGCYVPVLAWWQSIHSCLLTLYV